MNANEREYSSFVILSRARNLTFPTYLIVQQSEIPRTAQNVNNIICT